MRRRARSPWIGNPATRQSRSTMSVAHDPCPNTARRSAPWNGGLHHATRWMPHSWGNMGAGNPRRLAKCVWKSAVPSAQRAYSAETHTAHAHRKRATSPRAMRRRQGIWRPSQACKVCVATCRSDPPMPGRGLQVALPVCFVTLFACGMPFPACHAIHPVGCDPALPDAA